MSWLDDVCVLVITSGTRDEILAGGGEHRTQLRFPRSVPKLTPAELDHADALMRAWDAKNATKEAA